MMKTCQWQSLDGVSKIWSILKYWHTPSVAPYDVALLVLLQLTEMLLFTLVTHIRNSFCNKTSLVVVHLRHASVAIWRSVYSELGHFFSCITYFLLLQLVGDIQNSISHKEGTIVTNGLFFCSSSHTSSKESHLCHLCVKILIFLCVSPVLVWFISCTNCKPNVALLST